MAMTDNPTIACSKHGQERAAFVCQHIAETLVTREPVGFWWSRDDHSEMPDAWCSACHRRHTAAGFEWGGKALAELGAKLVCASCYSDAKRMCLGE